MNKLDPLHSGREKSALVTGAAGFIGSNLVDTLLASGWRVTGIDRRSPDTDPVAAANLQQALTTAGFTFEQADVTDTQAHELRKTDVVFHLAAATGVRPSWGMNFAGYMRDNIAATHHLVQECERAAVRRLVLASSSSVYGTAPQPSTEDGPLLPISPYGVSKLAAEQLALAYAARSIAVTSTVALRFFTVYGPRQRPDMAISRMLDAVRTGEPMNLYGDGQQRRNFTFVTDAVRALLLAATTGTTGQAVNIAGPTSVTVQTVLDTVEEITGQPVPIVRTASRSGDPASTEADTRRATAALGYRPAVDLTQGITRQWQWMRAAQSAPLIGGTA
ncbi:SDR family NAD(P)-dependent oxidoreductase [Streptomyces sp. NPDC091204]|uniref:NAD-dependent epimerase/dehydratase family protein n=1 Tax=Streptomyces sp. NPDC091204 TaxID=3155299 RepID=UPI00341F30AB